MTEDAAVKDKMAHPVEVVTHAARDEEVCERLLERFVPPGQGPTPLAHHHGAPGVSLDKAEEPVPDAGEVRREVGGVEVLLLGDCWAVGVRAVIMTGRSSLLAEDTWSYGMP